MEAISGLLLIAVIVFIVLWISRKPKSSSTPMQDGLSVLQRMQEEAQEFCDKIHEQNGIPEISVSIQMKRGEKAFLQDKARFFEQRAKTVSTRGGGAVRVARGLYIGGSQGVSRSVPEMREIDFGDIYFTNKRIVFIGANAVKEYPLSKIISLEATPDGFWISSEGREKRQLFQINRNSLIWSALLSIQNKIVDGDEIPHFTINLEG